MSTDPADGLDAVATTSRITAAARAAESARPDRLFHDPYAATLAGEAGRAVHDLMPAAGVAITIRTRFVDDAVGVAAGAGIRQIVLVAAGMDTRAWRLGLPGECVVFELDRPALLRLKEQLLDGERPGVRRVPVPVDLTAGWPSDLRDAGFDPARPTCWIVEGLLQYLPEASVLRLLELVTELSAPGSHLLTDFVGAGFLASPRTRPILDAMEAAGSPWLFGTDEPEHLLADRGWTGDVRLLDQVATGLGRPLAPDAPGDGTADERGYLVHVVRREPAQTS